MNSFFAASVVLALVFATLSSPSSGTTVRSTSNLTNLQIVRALSKAVRDNGACKINACFALQGSRFIPAQIYIIQKMIVSIVARVVVSGSSAQVAAVQYSAANSAISPLTRNATQLVQNLSSSNRGKLRESFIGGAILYCADQIRAFPDDTNKMVLLGNGQNTLGFDPFSRADVFRRLGGEIFAVGIGPRLNEQTLLKIVDGDDSNLFVIRGRNRDEVVIDTIVGLVSGLCGISKRTLEDSLQ